jgi:hypothetical protein
MRMNGSGTVWYKPRIVIPNPRKRARIFTSARVGVRSLYFIEKLAKQKVSPGYSPADNNAGSLTPVEVTLHKWFGKREKFKLCRYPNGTNGNSTICIRADNLSAVGASQVSPARPEARLPKG